MPFRSSHRLKDSLRDALLSQTTDVGPGVGPDGFDHGGAFAGARFVLRGGFPREGSHGQHEWQQDLHDHALGLKELKAPSARR